MVLAPTRELAIQLYKEFLVFNSRPNSLKVRFLRKKLIPKAPEEVELFNKNTAVLVSTPFRMATLALADLRPRFLIIDEADKLFEMGFQEQVQQILTKIDNPNL